MVVWGFTAGLLDAILEAAGLARPWDTTDVRPLPAGAAAPVHAAGHAGTTTTGRRRRRADGRRSRAGRAADAYGSAPMSGRATAGAAAAAVRPRSAGRWPACSPAAAATSPAAAAAVLGAVRRRHGDDRGADGVQEITLQTQDDYVFTPDRFTVAPGTVRLTVVNVAKQMTHNLQFTRARARSRSTRGSTSWRPGRRRPSSSRSPCPGDYPFDVHVPRRSSARSAR